jgi:phosphoglycolate phosphatase-like HAD superfamily hydrolase
MFGDRPEDIIAAKSANIPAIGISQSVFSSSELLDSGASLVYDNFNMALDGINEILSLLLRGSIRDKR